MTTRRPLFSKRMTFNVLFILTMVGVPLFVFTMIGSSLASTDTKDWDGIVTNLNTEAQAVENISAYFVLKKYYSSQIRNSTFNNNKQLFVTNESPHPRVALDANESSVLFWTNDGIRWRWDKKRLYPQTGSDFMQSIYDGEYYYNYNPTSDLAEKTGKPSFNPDFVLLQNGDCSDYVANTILGNGIIQRVQDILKFTFANSKPQHTKTENIDGKDISVYSIMTPESTFKVWYSLDFNAITRFQFETDTDKEKYALVVVAEDFKQYKQFWFPHRVKQELYRIRNHTKVWRNTVVVDVPNINVNSSISSLVFSKGLLVGTPISDTLESPGTISLIGGATRDDILKVRKGTPPPLEISGVSADGTAPIVSSGQEKFEDRQ